MKATKFHIETPKGKVYGFNRSMFMVQVAGPGMEPKQFSFAAAQKFIANYADAGTGLVSATARIVEA